MAARFKYQPEDFGEPQDDGAAHGTLGTQAARSNFGQASDPMDVGGDAFVDDPLDHVGETYDPLDYVDDGYDPLGAAGSAYGSAGYAEGFQEAFDTYDPLFDVDVAGTADQDAYDASVPGAGVPSRSAGPEAASSHYRGKSRRMGAGKIALIVVLALVVVVGAAGGVLAMRFLDSVKSVKEDAQAVMSELESIGDAVKGSDPARLQESARAISEGAHGIREEVNSELWGLVKRVPVYGQDIECAQGLSDVLVDLADNALGPLAASSDIMSLSHVFSEGTVNIGALRGLMGAIDEAAPVLSRSADALTALPPTHVGQVTEIVDKAREKIVQADDLIAKAQAILPHLPAVLGEGGQTRTYLIIAQTNSEVRSAGGFPGAIGTLTATDGRLGMNDFIAGTDLKFFAEEAEVRAAPTEEEVRAFGAFLAYDPLACTYTPAFDRVSQLAKSFWEQTYDTHVDGVIGIDPVFLQRMLALSGGVTTSDGTVIDGTNAAEALLSQVYWDYGFSGFSGHVAEDEFFVEVASLSAHQLMNSLGDMPVTDFYQTLVDSADDRRLQVWLEREEEERLMEDLGFAALLPTDPARPVLMTLANDDTWSKIDWYLKLDTTLSEPRQNDDGSRTYDVTTVLSNTMTYDEAYAAPEYVVGTNPYKRSAGDMITTMYFFAPAGGSIHDVWCDYDEVEAYPLSAAESDDFTGTCYGLQYWLRCVRTYPESSTTFTYQITVPAEAEGDPVVRTSPLGRMIG